VHGGVDDVGDVVLVLELGALDAHATTALHLEGIHGHGLDVTLGAHGDDEFLVVDEVLDVEIADVIGDLTASALSVGLLDLAELVGDDGTLAALVEKDEFQFRDGLAQLGHVLLEPGTDQAGGAATVACRGCARPVRWRTRTEQPSKGFFSAPSSCSSLGPDRRR